MIVVKFGGSSLANPERMLAAARIVADHVRREPVVCVVSAMAGVTDQLLNIARRAAEGVPDWQALYAAVRDRHQRTLAALAGDAGDKPPITLEALWADLVDDANGLMAHGTRSGPSDAIAAFSAWGERLSVRLFAAALARVDIAASCFEDAPVIVECDYPHAATWHASVPSTAAWLRDPITNLLQMGQTPVLPGYLALTQDGCYTTLGRNGSDHSAAVIGATLNASAVYLYSDVAGIFEADPRVIPQAKLLTTLTYDEAATIAATGARVLHPATLPPLAQRGIPLHLRSALAPDAPGTDIGLSSRQAAATHTAAFLPAFTAPLCGVKVGRPDAF